MDGFRSQEDREWFDGFRSQEDREWFDSEFVNRPVLVERRLQITDTDPPPLFIQRVREYGWEQVLTREKRVRAPIVRECVSSLVRVPGRPYTYDAYVRGTHFTLTPESVGGMIGIAPAAEYYFPYEGG